MNPRSAQINRRGSQFRLLVCELSHMVTNIAITFNCKM